MYAQFQQFWSKLSGPMKAIYAGVATAMLAIVSWVGYSSSQTQYAVLFSKLPPEDAAAIVQKLEADRTSFKLTADGTTILVPVDKVPNVRMNLVSAGVMQGAGKGYELFDTMSMGATPFVQNMNYVRAIQGELARTIMQLEPVANARVHIVQPEPTPFVREEKPVTASVVIKTKPGASLSRSATAGIVALTAGSVKGLTPENVTVLDSDGRVLSEKRDSRHGMASSDQLTYQREVESHLAENAQEILARLLGPGRAVVRVTAEMSFRHLKESSEKYDPDAKVVIRESVMSSKISAVTAGRGIAGATSNIPPAPMNGTANAGPNKNDETIESEYVVSKVNNTKEEQQGTIDRLTVAVMLIPPGGAADAPLEETLGISQAEAQELVKQAVGFKDGRDKIQVSVGKGPGGDAAADAVVNHDGVMAAAPFGNDFVSILRGSSLGIAGLVALAIAVMAFRRKPAASLQPAYASMNRDLDPPELADLHAVTSTIKAWLEEPPTIPFGGNKPNGNSPQAKPA